MFQAKGELRRADFEVGQVIRDHVIPRAVLFFTGETDLGDDMLDYDGDVSSSLLSLIPVSHTVCGVLHTPHNSLKPKVLSGLQPVFESYHSSYFYLTTFFSGGRRRRLLGRG